jgi:HD-GYP domain-containing protein (c-di-GMP phosphodiesterase class II)
MGSTETTVCRTPKHRSCRQPAAAPVREPWRILPAGGSDGAGCYEEAGELPISENEAVLFALARAVEQRHSQTAGHCERLALISLALGMAMRLERGQLMAIYRGGFLHDVGKVGIPDSILFKPGKLTKEEWRTMCSHTVRGEEICRPLASLAPVLPLIRHHHERWDGSGYPDGLRGEQIPLSARVLQIADIYDALINPRPYKPAFPPDHALRIIRQETDCGWRDPEVVDVFLRLHDSVISKIAEQAISADRGHQAMRASLANLQDFLSSAQAEA